MGWTFRRSLSFGPVRLNLGKSGVGYSVGGRGFRSGVRANGRTYTRTSVPGTGLSYTQEHGRGVKRLAASTGCGVVLTVPAAVACVPVVWWLA